MRAITVALILLIPISFYASARSNSGGLAERVVYVVKASRTLAPFSVARV